MAATTTTRRTPMQRLVAQIAEYQERYGLSDSKMAAKLGLPRTTWTSIRNGQYPPRLEFAQTAARIMEFREAAVAVLVPAEARA